MPSLSFNSIKRLPSLWVTEAYFATDFNDLIMTLELKDLYKKKRNQRGTLKLTIGKLALC